MQGQKAFSLATLINIIFIFGESLDREVMGLILVTSEFFPLESSDKKKNLGEGTVSLGCAAFLENGL